MATTLALLDKLKTEMPEIWGQAQVVGQWVWLEFNIPPLNSESQVKETWFPLERWPEVLATSMRFEPAWSDRDPKEVYPVIPAPADGTE